MAEKVILINPDDLADVLKEAVRTYTEDIRAELDEELERIGKEAVKEMWALSPKTTGKYRRGWTYTVKRERGTIKVIIHNKLYQLVHLLELGHLLKDGTGRKYGEVPPIVHVATVQQNVNERVEKLLKEFGG